MGTTAGTSEVAGAWLDSLAADVDSQVRQRGEQYLEQGAVARLAIDDFGVRATVSGSREYTVTILYDGPIDEAEGGLLVRSACNCPHFARGAICKHIWASLLAAARYDGGSRLPAADGDGSPVLEPDESLPLRRPETPTVIGNPVVIDLADDPLDADADDAPPPMPRAQRRSRPLPPPPGDRKSSALPPRVPDWQQTMAALVWARVDEPGAIAPFEPWPADRQIMYVLDLKAAVEETRGLPLDVMVRWPKRDGNWSKPQARRIERGQLPHLPDPEDRTLLSLLDGAAADGRVIFRMDEIPSRFYLDPSVQVAMVRRLCASGRCFVRSQDDPQTLVPLTWREEPTWSFGLMVEDRGEAGCVIRGELRQPVERKSEAGADEAAVRRMSLSEPRLLTVGGLMFLDDEGTYFESRGGFEWITLLRETPQIAVPAAQVEQMLEQVLTLPGMPPVELPERLGVERVPGQMRPHLRIYQPRQQGGGGKSGKLLATLLFAYGERTIGAREAAMGVYEATERRLLERDIAAEQQAWARLRKLNFREPSPEPQWWSPFGEEQEIEQGDLEVAARNVPAAVATLVEEGWLVEAEGTLHRPAGTISMDLRGSGIDWFELHGHADFDGRRVELPELLRALQRGEKYIRLDDGSRGILPEQWVDRYGSLGRLGEHSEDGHVRLAPTQIGLVDALLMQMPEVDFDEQVAEARQRLEDFSRIRPRKAPRGFNGELRPYQKDGLGWLHFLQKIGFGGCLADDMGLGKTVQVLALLESRRIKRRRDKGATPPSLVVAPRSLVHNWEAEAKRFTPKLRVLDHTGPQRLSLDEAAENNGDGPADPLAHFEAYDLVLTTYGTLRQDIAMLKDVPFDYVVLDETQAIKNATTASAKAARLLRGEHRLALSGTPIENHLGELVSLFEFLNPGMLGDPEAWTGRSGGAAARADAANHDQCQLLARAVKPFMLRRTKEQVAPDLPEKVEQTLYCDLPAKQRKLYDELRSYYGAQVMGKVESRGLKRSKIDVLQALLRLRQAACHPGLIDKARTDERAAKLDMLLPQLEEIADEGHKALVFSQFTSFLSIVRRQVEAKGIGYAYIDGRVRKRQQQVERFQNDPDCKLFLISLKAGGTGLNLTAADYVFLLDPWWNPAVEAQAIDRAHRIGQDKRVHAYRLIASDTVEEKVLELQQSKRALADAIIRADTNLIRELSVDDLRYLLS